MLGLENAKQARTVPMDMGLQLKWANIISG